MTQVSRRSVTKAAAWSAPAVVAATSVPAFAASRDYSDEIEDLFDDHTRSLKEQNPDADKVALQFSWHMADQENGQSGEGAFKMTNVGKEPFKHGDTKADPTGFGLAFEFAAVNVNTSPAVNNTLGGKVTVSGPLQHAPIAQPWGPMNDNEPAPGDALFVNQNRGQSQHRDLSVGSSFVVFRKHDTWKINEKDGHDGYFNGRSGPSEWTTADGRNVYGFTATFKKGISPLRPTDLERTIAYSFQSGDPVPPVTQKGQVYVALGMRPIGFAPPTWEDVVKMAQTNHPGLTLQQIEQSYRDAYTKRSEKWYRPNEEGVAETMLGMKFYYLGWAKGYDHKPRLSHGDWFWSHEAGLFRAINAEGNQGGLAGKNTDPLVYFNTQRASYHDAIKEISVHDGIY